MKTSITKIIILIICLLVTSYFVYNQPKSRPTKKNISLAEALAVIDGWKTGLEVLLEANIVDELKLDDYIYQVYSKDGKQISLYIGYYFSGDKIGAAHDPLVCFPGQGWIIKDHDEGISKLNTNQETPISYSSMVVERGQDRQLLLYWFQSYDKTNPDTFSQKFSSLWAKIGKRGEDSAFVRVSMSIGNNSVSENKEAIIGFINDFYPVFLKYIYN